MSGQPLGACPGALRRPPPSNPGLRHITLLTLWDFPPDLSALWAGRIWAFNDFPQVIKIALDAAIIKIKFLDASWQIISVQKEHLETEGTLQV
ncbi:Small Conductance Calcium-Activated Potassium Channel Protein 1 [Manis pentadactyla]|nr:Small Conductance Calcium-Activated Potassium Channel Protein 1 [Manis pentadactyla]